MSAKRPKLVPGHTYRFTFTPTEALIAARPYNVTPYTTTMTISKTPDGVHTPKSVTMWANRWCTRGRYTVEIVELVEESASEVVTAL